MGGISVQLSLCLTAGPLVFSPETTHAIRLGGGSRHVEQVTHGTIPAIFKLEP
jgi:hypothetical protein